MVVALAELDLDLDPAEEGRARVEDKLVDIGPQLVEAEVGDAAVLVRLAHREQGVAAVELDRDAAGRLAALGVEDVCGDAHPSASYSCPVDERERFLIRYAGSFAPVAVARAEGRGSRRPTASGSSTSPRADLLDARPQPPADRGGRCARALDDVVHLNSWMLSEPVLALGERLAGSSRRR